MSHIHDGPLATYNSLTDQNLSGYFGNTRMRRHLRKSGLVNRRGELVTENQYRVNMARKEHKKHVKELLAQAIVHKTLDLERYRQVEIKRKLEEISKIELVRRVRATRGRKGDEEVLPYLSPRSMSRPQSERPSQSSNVHRRPKSAPAPPRNRPASSRGFVDPYEDVIYVDDDGRPVSPPPSDRAPSDRASSKDLKTEGIDTRHLYALDSEALQKYALKLSKREQGRDGAVSPYLISQFPVPPRSPRSERVRSARSPRRSARMSARPEGPRKEKKVGVREEADTTDGALMLHRSEPAMMHQGEVQTLCEITMKYHGPNLTLPRDQNDPTQEVAIDQQHCGGNTLPVFKERLQGGKTFSFISRRHRGYPFSLTLYIDGRVDCRVSTCCEYKHGVGVRLGGKMGHFSLTGITGATPCYKCKLSCQAPPRSLKLKKSGKKKKAPEPQEEVTVDNTPRSPVVPSKREEPEVNGKSDDDYEDDFEEDNKYEDDFEPEPTEDRRQIIGLQVDEVRENGQTVKVDVKEKEEEEAKEGTLPDHRRIEGYSSEDEDLQGGREPFRVNAVVHETKKKKVRRSSSSSSSDSSRPTTPVPEKVIPVKVVGVKADATPEKKKRRGSSSSSSSSSSNSDSSRSTTPVPASAVISSKADVPLKSDRTEATTERSTTSTTSGSLTTATESTLEPRPPSAPKPRKGRGNKSSTSSSSSDSSMDSDDEKYKRKKRDKRLKEESERMKREMEEKERERKKRQEEDEARKKKEEEERKKRFEEEDRRRNEELRKREEERKQREIEINERKREEERKKQEEQQKRQAEEDRMKAEYEKQLLLIKQQRESDDNIVVNKPESNERSVIEIESRPTYTSAPAQQESVTPIEKAPSSSSDTDSSTSGTTTTTESEPDKDKGKPNVAPMTTITEEKEKPKERRSSSSSTGSSSSSSSDGEYAVNEQKKEAEPAKDEVKPVPVVTETVEVKAEQKETLVPPQSQQKASSSEGSSSSSGSSTESESDEDNKRVGSPKQAVMEVHERQPLVEEPVAKSMAADEPPQPVTAETVSYQQKKEETEDSSSDSSSSDSSDSSDSESESKDNKRPKTAMGGRSVSESDGENMHGGNDPENVASANFMIETRLAQSPVKAPVPVDGSILPLIRDKDSVELNGVRLSDDQVTELCNYLGENENVTSLTLRNAGIDDAAFQNIALALQVTLSSPKLLNFSQNKLGGKAMTNLSPPIKKNVGLDILILNGNPIGNGGCKVIVDAILKAKDPFPFLRRSSGYLTPSEARAQAASSTTTNDDGDDAENKCTIKELDLGDTNISDAGVSEVSRLLENNKTLVSLNMNGNTEISVNGWERLGQALKKNGSLKTLSLDFTKIGDAGLEALVRGLKENTGLRALELESAGLSQKGGELLIDLLKANTSLLELSVATGNNIPDSTLKEIRNYLSLNNTSTRH